MKLLLGTNLFGNNHRQSIAIDSWINVQIHFPDTIQLCNIQLESDPSPTEDSRLETIKISGRSAKDVIPGSTKNMPVLSDLFNNLYTIAKERGNVTHFAYVNSDCCLTNVVAQYLSNTKVSALAVSRVDVADKTHHFHAFKSTLEILRLEPAGYDLFIFSLDWWEKHGSLFGDYILGAPLFDPIYAGIIRLYGGSLYYDPANPMVCHIYHPIVSHNNTPEKAYNETVMKANPFDHLVCNMMFYNLQYNLAKRKPWGAYLQPWGGEQVFEKDFFETFSLVTENQVKYIQ